MNMDVCKTDIALAARLLAEAAACMAANATSAKMADTARRMKRLSKKLLKKIDNEQVLRSEGAPRTHP